MIGGVPLVLAGLLVAAAAWPAAGQQRAASRCLAGLTFVDAVVSAGSTDYVFRVADGVSLFVRIDNEAAAADGLEGFVALQDDGPAEANPERIGKSYTLCFASQVAAAEN